MSPSTSTVCAPATSTRPCLASFDGVRKHRGRRLVWIAAAAVLAVSCAGSVEQSALGEPPGTSAVAGPAVSPGEACGEPIRVLGIGDSIAAQAVGPALDTLSEMGFETRLDARWGSGLLDSDPDWMALARRHAASFDPALVLVLFYGNYSQPVVGLSGLPIEAGSAASLELWAERARQFTEVFTGTGVPVSWISPPPEPPKPGDPGTTPRSWTYAAREVREIPGVQLLASGRLLSDSDGSWVSSIVDDAGRSQQVRDPDRIHLLPFSADLMAADIVRHVVERQLVEGCPG